MIRIAMIFTSKFQYTGITMVVMNYYREIIKNKEFSIDFIIPNEPPKELKEEIELNNSKIFILPMKLRRKKVFQYMNNLKNILRQNQYDMVQVHGSSSIMGIELYCAKKANIKIRIAHSHNTKTEHPILNKLMYAFFKNNYTNAFACGTQAGKWLFNNEQFYIVRNAQHIDKFKFNTQKREEIRKKYNLDNKIVLGHVGNFCYQKNQEFLIKLLKDLVRIDRKYYLVFVGNGKRFNKIKKLVEKEKISDNVLFIGKVANVNEWLNAFDIMLLPSRYEGLPNVVIEWQISELPSIVSTKVTTEVKITDLVNFKELNIKKWIDAILQTNINKRRENIEIIQKIEENGYDIKRSSKLLEEKYKQILKEVNNE